MTPDDIWTDTRAMLDKLNQAIFLKYGPSQLHNAFIKSERCDACMPALNHIKNQYQVTTRFFRRSCTCMRSIKYWTKRNNEKKINADFFFFL